MLCCALKSKVSQRGKQGLHRYMLRKSALATFHLVTPLQTRRPLIIQFPSFTLFGAALALSAGLAQSASAASQGNRFTMTLTAQDRCFQANGLPDHATGTFPNKGNPNGIEPQTVSVCAPLTPQRTGKITEVKATFGIAINGVQFRPNTAGFYDPVARRGHSRQGDKSWSLDIHGAPGKLGLDFNNAHVGPGGLYHYHGIAKALTQTSGSSLVGYAGDGFEVHYIGATAQSGWQLKDGTRSSGPSGRYDGTYNEDYVFNGETTPLDQCNGGFYGDKYVYFITDSYPFVPRCSTGKVSADFNRSRH